jgi:hypothetical protein
MINIPFSGMSASGTKSMEYTEFRAEVVGLEMTTSLKVIAVVVVSNVVAIKPSSTLKNSPSPNSISVET